MTYSPLQPNLPLPSSPRPHQGCAGTRVNSSRNAPQLNRPTLASTSLPPPLRTPAESWGITPPLPHCTTKENPPETPPGTTQQLKREYLPKKN